MTRRTGAQSLVKAQRRPPGEPGHIDTQGDLVRGEVGLKEFVPFATK